MQTQFSAFPSLARHFEKAGKEDFCPGRFLPRSHSCVWDMDPGSSPAWSFPCPPTSRRCRSACCGQQFRAQFVLSMPPVPAEPQNKTTSLPTSLHRFLNSALHSKQRRTKCFPKVISQQSRVSLPFRALPAQDVPSVSPKRRQDFPLPTIDSLFSAEPEANPRSGRG